MAQPKNNFRKEYIAAAVLFAGYIFLCLTQGRLNYDEGYYLTAIQNVQNGLVPYKDFAYAQGAFLPYFNALILKPFALNVLNARLLNVLYLLLSVTFIWKFIKPGKVEIIFSLLLFTLLSLEPLYFLTIFKTYGLASLFLVSAVILYLKSTDNKNGNHLLIAIYLSLFATLIRYSLFPFPLFFGIILLVKTIGEKSPENLTRFVFALLPIPLILLFVKFAGFENIWFHSVDFHTSIHPKFNFWKRSGILIGIYIANYWPVFATMILTAIWSIKNSQWNKGGYLYIPFIIVGLLHFLTGTMQSEYQTVIYLPLATYLIYLTQKHDELQKLMSKSLLVIGIMWLILQPVNFIWSGYGFLEGRENTIHIDQQIKLKLKKLKASNPELKTILSQDLSFTINSEFESFRSDYLGMFTYWEECGLEKHLFCPNLFQALIDKKSVDIIIYNERFLAKIYPSGAKYDNIELLNSIKANYEIVDSIPIAGQYLERYWVGVKR